MCVTHSCWRECLKIHFPYLYVKKVNYNTTNYLSRGRQALTSCDVYEGCIWAHCPSLLRLRSEFGVQFSLRQHLWWPEQSLFAKWGEDLCIFPFGRSKVPIAHMFSHIVVLSQLTESLLQLTVSAKLTPSQGPVVTTPQKTFLDFSWNFLRAFIYLESPFVFWDLCYLMLFLTLQTHLSSSLLCSDFPVVSVQTDMASYKL